MAARMIRIYSAILIACALTASSPVITRADDDGVVRVKSAYPIGQTIERLKEDCGKGHQVLRRNRSIEARRRDRDKASAVGAAHLRQSAARNSVHHRQCQCRPRLAGAAARIRERKRRSLDRAHRFQLDRTAARYQEPQRPAQDGINRHCLDHGECERKVMRCRNAGALYP